MIFVFMKKDSFDAAPDRLTALRAFEELRAASPNRRWKMVLVDAEKEELARERQRRIAKLLYPHDTVLDDSIGGLNSLNEHLQNSLNYEYIYRYMILFRLCSVVCGAWRGKRRVHFACSSATVRHVHTTGRRGRL